MNPDPRAAIDARSNESMLYWVEGSSDTNVTAHVRYALFSGENGVTLPKTLGRFRPTNAASASQAHYNYSGSFLGPHGDLSFLAHWHQGDDGVKARIVSLPPEPGPERFNAIWVSSNDDRREVWSWAWATALFRVNAPYLPP